MRLGSRARTDRIAARTVGLSNEAQQDLVQKVDELRRREHLDD